jgi:hypothetical protein
MGLVYFVALTVALLGVERLVAYKGSYRSRLTRIKLLAANATS